MKYFYLILFSLCFFACRAKQQEITLQSIDDNGALVEKSFTQREYQKTLESLLASVNDSTMPTLEKTDSASAWALRTAIVGVGLKVDVNAGPIGIGINPGMRFVFSNATKPTIP
jgi:hypothetical protein